MPYYVHIPTGRIVTHPVQAILYTHPDYAGPMTQAQAREYVRNVARVMDMRTPQPVSSRPAVEAFRQGYQRGRNERPVS
jgi:hypothetical protein